MGVWEAIAVLVGAAGLVVTALQVWGFGEDRARRLAERELVLAGQVKDKELAQDLRTSAHQRLRSMLGSRGARAERNDALRDAGIVTVGFLAIWVVMSKLATSTPTWLSLLYVSMWAVYVLLVPVAWVRFALAFRRVGHEGRS